MVDPARWDSFRNRFHADELVRTDELRAEVEGVLREHGGLSDAAVQERLRSFDQTFGRDGRIYNGQNRPTELRNLWLWVDNFDDSGSRETLRAPEEAALGLAPPSTGETLTLSERLLHVIRPRIQNDVSLERNDFRDYFSRGEFNLRDVPPRHREAMERLGLWDYFSRLDGNDDGRVQLNASQARMLFSSTEYRPDKDGSGRTAVLAFRPHDDVLVEDASGARLTELGRGFLSMDSMFTPEDGVERPAMLEAAGYVAASVDPDYAPSDVAAAAAADVVADAADEEVANGAADEAAEELADGAADVAAEELADGAADVPAEELADGAADVAAEELADGAAVANPEGATDAADEEAADGAATASSVAIAGRPLETAAIEMPERMMAELNGQTEVNRQGLAALFAGRTWDPRSRDAVGVSGTDPNDRERIEAIEGFEGNRLSMETVEGLTGSDRVFSTEADWHALFGELERIDANGDGSTIRLIEENGSLSPTGQVVAVIAGYEGQTVNATDHRNANAVNAFNFDLLDQPWSDDSDQTGRDRLVELARTAYVSEEAQNEFIRRVEGLSGRHLGAAPAQLIYHIADILDNSGSGDNVILSAGPTDEMRRTAAGQAYDILTSLGSRDANFPRHELDDTFTDRNGVRPVHIPTWDDVPESWRSMVGLSVGSNESEAGLFAQRVLTQFIDYDLSAVGGVDGHYGNGSHVATEDAIRLWNYYTGRAVQTEQTFNQEMVIALYGMSAGRVIDRLPERMRAGIIRTDVFDGGVARPQVLRQIDGAVHPVTGAPLDGALARTPAALAFTAFSHFLTEYDDVPQIATGPNGPNAFRTSAHQLRLIRNPRYNAAPQGNSLHQGGWAVDYGLNRPGGWDDWGLLFGVSRDPHHRGVAREAHHWEYRRANRLPEEVRRFFHMPTADEPEPPSEPFARLRDLLLSG